LKGAKQRYLTDMKENLCTRDLTEATAMNENLFLQPTIYGGDPEEPGPGVVTTPGKPDPKFLTPEEKEELQQQEDDRLAAIEEDVQPFLGEDGLWKDHKTGTPIDGYDAQGNFYIKGELQGEETGGFPDSPGEKVPGAPIAYLLHIYYDFDQAYIRPDAETELEQLYTTMTQTPEIIVEIGSHTDSRGTKSYNKRLSQRRADAVVKWLVKKGIERDRLVSVGYGETLTVNNCKDFIPCTERDHQLNRRTEFRVIGC